MTRRYSVVGFSRGTVMYHHFVSGPAPSTSAASYSSFGSEPIAAEYSTTPPPGIVRTALRMTAASAWSELLIQSWGPTPKTPSTVFARPYGLALKIQRHTIATRIAEFTSGR